MGSCYSWVMLQGETVAELEKEYKAYVQQLEAERGERPDNGTLSTCSWPKIVQKRFVSPLEAQDFVSQHTNSGEAMAVRIAEIPPFNGQPEERKLNDRFWKIRNILHDMERQALTAFRASGRQSHTCPECGTASAAAAIRSYLCPACKEPTFLLTRMADRRKYAAAVKKLGAVQRAEVTAARNYYAKKAAKPGVRYIWYVGGWAIE